MSKMGWGGRLTTVLSPFNIGLYLFTFLSPIFFLLPWDLNMAQGLFFNFGVLVLLALSFISKRERDYRNKYLAFFILWALLSLVIHSFNFNLANSIANKFITFCLLSEGFLFVLCGCLLFYLIVNYSKNFKIIYPILAINILNLIFAVTQKMGIHWIWSNNQSISGVLGQQSQLALFSALSIPIVGIFNPIFIAIPLINLFLSSSYTSILALFITFAYYCHRKKRKERLIAILAMLVIVLIIKHDFFFQKLYVRSFGWLIVLKEIVQRPFLGWGFDNMLNMNMVSTKFGMVYRHNDFLNIAKDLGLPFLAGIILFLRRIFKKSTMDYLWLSLMIIIIGCLGQTNFYFARIASIGIILLALKEVQNEKDGIMQQVPNKMV